jgi:hypothetical protein
MWDGHVHMQFHRSKEMFESMTKCVEYILKYYTKSESSFIASIQRDSDVIAQIKSRFVSCEEATARIFS